MQAILFVLLAAVVVLGCGDDSGGSSDASSAPPAANNVGQGGSMSRFTIINDYLYTISGRKLQLFDLTDPSTPTPWANVSVGFGIETLFSQPGYLYIGAQDGMYIYDNSDPANPVRLSLYAHRRSCDPVVVQGDYAYVTLRGGGFCGTVGNQLDVIDIADKANPILKRTYPMQGPAGLGVDGDKLFVCDGTAGLKIFDKSDPLQLIKLETITNIDCFDVIPSNYVLIVSDALGLIQYDYTNTRLQILSKILITQ